MAEEHRGNQNFPDDSWRTPSFRQSVVNKINEAILQSGVTSAKNSQEMENHVFQKSKSKDEYLGYVARLILHVREMNRTKNPPNAQQDPNQAVNNQQMQQQQSQVPQQQQQQPQGNMMPDPINALQNLATQGSRMPMQPMQGQSPGPMQPTNLLQTLTQQRPMQPMGGMHSNMGPQRPQMMPQQMMTQMSGGMMSMTPGGGGMGNMGAQQGMGGMGGQGMGPQQGMVPQQGMQGQMMPGQMGSGQMGAPGMRQQGPMGQMMNPQGPMGGQPINPMQMQMQNPIQGQMQPQGMQPQMPRMQAVPSPMQGMTQHMIPSPALVPSPSPQMGPGSMLRGQMGMMAPSPNASLNTPGQPIRSNEAAPSPLNNHDEQIYREKYRQLTKYIEPLKKMIARMGDGDGDRLLKLKKLLEILSNPQSRIPLETLLKCEAALENQLGTVKEHTANNPLLEAISGNLQSPLFNHTLQRTFRPCVESLFGPDIRNLPPPIRRPRSPPKETSSGPDISHVLQGEIARLDPKFKVTLDPAGQIGSKTIKLICWLDDKYLPCVPPIHVTIPEDYPESLPECVILEQEYGTTDFLSTVKVALVARMEKLPKQHSLSHILDTWEIAVRQACAPKLSQPDKIAVYMNT